MGCAPPPAGDSPLVAAATAKAPGGVLERLQNMGKFVILTRLQQASDRQEGGDPDGGVSHFYRLRHCRGSSLLHLQMAGW